jgi:putative ABC transport system substrate-binding protein
MSGIQAVKLKSFDDFLAAIVQPRVLNGTTDRAIERRDFLRWCALSLFAAPLLAAAPPKVAHIGIVSFGSPSPDYAPTQEAFRQTLRALGWVEGQSVVFDYRWAEGSLDRLQDISRQVVDDAPDVVYAITTPVAMAMSRATSKIPIVFTQVSDPMASGLVTSLGRPGRNVTGLTNMSPDLATKLLELLGEAVPRLAHVAVLWNSTNAGKKLEMKEIEKAAERLAIKVQSLAIQSREDFDRVLRATPRGRGTALIVLTDSVIFGAKEKIVSIASANRLPTIFQTTKFVEGGGLMSYGINDLEMSRRAAVYVDKILRGTSPATLPVERPTTFELVINSKTAKALGLTLPQSLLVRADKVIE